MVRIEFGPQERSQLSAIARVRWLVFVHSLRTAQGALELFSRIIISGMIALGGLGGAFGLGASAWYFVTRGSIDWLALLLWPVFMFWQFFPVMATAFTETLDASNLLRFPLNYRSYVLVRLAYGAMDPATALGGSWLLGIAIGIGIANPRLFLWSLLVLGLFAAMNVLLTQMIFAWVDRWLAQRRTREIFAVLFVLLLFSVQLIGPLMSRYADKPSPALERFGRQVSPVQRALPPGIAATAIASMARDHVGESSVLFATLLAYCVLILRGLSSRLRAQYRGENLGEVVLASRSAEKRQLPLGWRMPGLPGPITAVLEKEFRYLSRSGPVLLTLVTPIFMLVIFGIGQGRSEHGGFLQRSPGLGFPAGVAYSLLLLTNLIYNNFGADGGGIQFFLASPVRFRNVVLGKNLAHMAVLAVEIIAVWIGVSLIFRRPSLNMVLATLTALLFAAPANLAAGNLLSLYSPKRVEFGAFGRQRASQLTVLLSFAVQILVFGLCALTFLVVYYSGKRLITTIAFGALALTGLVVYAIALKQVDRVAEKRREVLTTELCR